MSESHVAGPPMKCNERVRQRCSWCGAVLIDQDLTLVGMMLNEDGTVPAFPVWGEGDYIRIDGGMRCVVDGAGVPVVDDVESVVDPQDVPDDSCLRLDFDVTA